MSFHYWRNSGRPREDAVREPRRELSRRDARRAFGHRRARCSRTLTRRCCVRAAQVPSPDRRRAAAGESRARTSRTAAPKRSSAIWQHITTASPRSSSSRWCRARAGMAMYDAVYLRRAREICDRFDVHLIADEIMTGFGRTGTFFAHEQAGITPDFLCLSKGITGGYLPLSVVHDHVRCLRRVLRRCAHARLPALAFVYRQCARLPRRAGDAGHLRNGSRDRDEPHESGGDERAA